MTTTETTHEVIADGITVLANGDVKHWRMVRGYGTSVDLYAGNADNLTRQTSMTEQDAFAKLDNAIAQSNASGVGVRYLDFRTFTWHTNM